ncbi:hypothetical protein JCM6882_005425 [Rhodosporidiobolus microsporus]
MAQPAVAFADPPYAPLAGGSGSGALKLADEPLAPRRRAAAQRNVIDLVDSSDDDGAALAAWTPAGKKRKAGGGGGDTGGGGVVGRADKGKGKGKGKAEVIDLGSDEAFWDEAGDLVMDERAASPPPPALPAAGSSGLTGASVSAERSRVNGFSHSPPPAAAAAAASDQAVATVCSILPDVLPSYVRDLLRLEMYGPGNVELVVEALLSSETGYPKREEEEKGGKGKGKGKEKAADEDEGVQEKDEDEEAAEVERTAKRWVETSGRKAGGKTYEDAALAQLYIDFPSIQQTNIKKLFQSSSSFYAPTYLAAQKALKQTDAERGFKLMAGGKGRVGKGKGKASDEYELERKWVVEELGRYLAVQRRAAQAEKQLEEEIASGAFFECGCCFTDCALSTMVTCDLGCPFCKECAKMNAESQIGMRKFILPCMSTSGCSSTFCEQEAQRFLPRKTLAALHKIRQEKEVDGAGIEGLEQCPFCPFAYIIENPDERLFHCQRDDCGVVSCRQCKKKDHLPQTCKEVDEDAIISSVHKVEEAMSKALIRRCPKCTEPYIKENGTCNKIVCASCRTLSCYVCGVIVKGYEHFANAGSNAPNGSEKGATCPLWEDGHEREFQEVEAARIAAEEAARKENAGVSEEHLKNLAMAKPGPAPHVVAHLPRPRIAAYEAVAGRRDEPVADARGRLFPPAPAARVPAPLPAPLPARRAADPPAARKRARFADAVAAAPVAPIPPAVAPPPRAYMPPMPDYPPMFGARAVPAPNPAPLAGGAGLNFGGLARAGHRAAAAAAAAAPAIDHDAVNARWRAEQERKRLAEEARKKARLDIAAAEEARRKRRREADEAREAKRKRTSGGRKQ